MRYYVVFEGRRSGITDSLPDCLSLTQGYSRNSYQGFKNYDEAVTAWVKHCNLIGRDSHYIQRGLLQTDSMQFNENGKLFSNTGYASGSTSFVTEDLTHAQSRTDSADCVKDEVYYGDDGWEEHHSDIGVTCYAEESQSLEWILQFNMQAQLNKICNFLRIEPAVYNIESVNERQGIKFVRYSASLNRTFVGTPITTCVGRFARSDYDAMEDVAAMVIRRLLNATGKKIRDFNYYNVRILEKKVNNLEEEKMQLNTEIQLLSQELEQMKRKGKGHRF